MRARRFTRFLGVLMQAALYEDVVSEARLRGISVAELVRLALAKELARTA